MTTKNITTPISEEDIASLQVGDMIYISGEIFCGRDAVLPKIVRMTEDGTIAGSGIELSGGSRQASPRCRKPASGSTWARANSTARP